jgi:hypothetical protein
MNIVRADNSELFSISRDELVALNNSVNEIVNKSNIGAHDCYSRIGVTLPELKTLLSDLNRALKSNDA